MSVKHFLISLLIAFAVFISGVLVGKYVLSPPVEIVVVDVDALATLIEKYNVQAEEIKKEFAKMKTWNENAMTEPPEAQPEEVEK